jgi:8-oxo-dGTP pyrophosphatase MutT (NUDIX family)
MSGFTFRVLPWRRLAQADIVANRWLTLRQDTCQRPDGGLVDDYFVLSEPDVACVVALTPDRQVVLVEQYKHGIGRACLEIPGGAFDEADADPLAVARRELLEETGYASDHWRPLGVLTISPTRTTVQMHLFAALDCVRVGGQSLDPNEEIIVHLQPMDEALALVRGGVIQAATSVAGLLLAAELGADR